MSYSISIVPKLSSYPSNKAKSLEILEWLIANDIVKSQITDCTLGNTGGYELSAGASRIVKEPEFLPFDLVTNGLEIVTERKVFVSGENFPEEIICPACLKDIVAEDWDVEPWAENKSDNMTCPLCGTESEINLFTFDWQWGFSDLGFIFWNWPEFTDEFLQEFIEKLNCEVNIVRSKL